MFGTFQEKIKNIQKKNNSNLVVGLDLELAKFPESITGKDAFFSFAKQIIDATFDSVVAYKPNIAFFEAMGLAGIEQLHKILAYIPADIPVILDAKRGDIGNTAKMYAKSVFEDYKADSVTLSPYMGADTLEPFLEYRDKYVFALVLTSNPGGNDLQLLKLEDGSFLYEKTCKIVKILDDKYQNCGAVVGATKPEYFSSVASILKNSYFLIPGIGTQGGSVSSVLTNCQIQQRDYCLFNVSRDVLYASRAKDFAQVAKQKAIYYKELINKEKESI